jgi:NhaP-type Na+/H+ or K+/H+ antiporter
MPQTISRPSASAYEATSVSPARHDRKRRLSPFWRHFLEMFAVMMVGMIAFAAVFVTIVGVKSWDEATTQYATASLLVIAAGMSLPMAFWMLWRGMGSRNSTEMAAAMVVPVIPFLCLVWIGATESALCGPYCLVAIGTMLGLMLYRRSDYSMEMARKS